ncbi:hypothetical protein QAD02_021622 [Eretmocerus hayati]|uniref:Uncharacterized protein n=1 Tax=Eretmocerus hayati TaxID=131215 RepID=A0ACC2PR87_9HYME|nr:hypothetical protein QAD02_021622 [Eretmocerus hayati]
MGKKAAKQPATTTCCVDNDGDHCIQTAADGYREWQESDVWKLIGYVRANPGLWMFNEELYRDVSFKKVAWKQIGAKLNIPWQICQDKWDTLKKAYRKEKMTRSKEMIKSGLGGPTDVTRKPRRGFYFFSGMIFLEKEKSPKSTVSNVSPTIKVEVTSSASSPSANEADGCQLSQETLGGQQSQSAQVKLENTKARPSQGQNDHEFSWAENQFENDRTRSISSPNDDGQSPPHQSLLPRTETVLVSDVFIDLCDDVSSEDEGANKIPMISNLIKQDNQEEDLASNTRPSIQQSPSLGLQSPTIDKGSADSGVTNGTRIVKKEPNSSSETKFNINSNIKLESFKINEPDLESCPGNDQNSPPRATFVSPWLRDVKRESVPPTSCYLPETASKKRKDPVVDSIINLTQVLTQTATAPAPIQHGPNANDAEDSFGSYVASELRKMESPERKAKKRKITEIIYETI